MPRGVAFVATVCCAVWMSVGVLRAAEENAGDLSKFTATTKTADGKVVTALRPLVRQISPREPLTAVLHWSSPEGAFQQDGGEGPVIDLAKTFDAATFTITTADGKQHKLQAKFTDARPEYWRNAQPAYRVATSFLTIAADGVRVIAPYGELSGKWTKKLPVEFSKSGDYKLSIAGELIGAGTTFATGDVKYQIAMGAISVAEAKKLAEAAIAKLLPEGKLPKNQQTESGFTPGMVYEDAAGHRVLHYNVQLGPEKWGFDLVRVTQERTGELVELAYTPVHTCLAEGTVIETPSGSRPIESLREGDEVLSFDVDRGVKQATRVVALRTLSAPAILQFGELRVTGEHPIYTPAGWLPATELTAKSQVVGVDGKQFAIGEGKRIDGEVKVFCLAVAPPHTYFAAGVLVHNKDRGWSAQLDDPWYFYWDSKPREWKKVQ
jgi:hypothetical protein